jgi:hypothetical protein
LATAILVSFDSPCMAKPHNKHKASISTPSYISQKTEPKYCYKTN